MTYADKYALIKAYKIISGDDPDQNKSEEMTKPITIFITELEINTLTNLFKRKGLNIEKVLRKNGITDISNITKDQYSNIINVVSKLADKNIDTENNVNVEEINGSNTEN